MLVIAAISPNLFATAPTTVSQRARAREPASTDEGAARLRREAELATLRQPAAASGKRSSVLDRIAHLKQDGSRSEESAASPSRQSSCDEHVGKVVS